MQNVKEPPTPSPFRERGCAVTLFIVSLVITAVAGYIEFSPGFSDALKGGLAAPVLIFGCIFVIVSGSAALRVRKKGALAVQFEEDYARAVAKADQIARGKAQQAEAERKVQQHLSVQLPTTPSESLSLYKDLLHCTRCHTPYEKGNAFCKKCGLALSIPGIETALATQTMTCPNCSATVPADATFCPKCGSTVSLVGTTEPTLLVDTLLPPTLLRDLNMVSTHAETVATTTRSSICPSCHTTIQLGPEDRFCGNCGHTLVQ